VLIEQCAYSNRWRRVSPAAKGLFVCCALVASMLATSPGLLFAMALCVAMATVCGAGIRLQNYLRAVLAPLFFLGISGVTLLVSLQWDNGISLHWQPEQLPKVVFLCGRSLSCLTALLLLALTTPMSDLIELLRRMKIPDVLLDMMTLSYRMIFVFLESVHDIRVAQAARLGFASNRSALRSLGSMTGNLAAQIWQRSRNLHLAAQARANDGPFVFLEGEYASGLSGMFMAVAAGFTLLALAMVFR
jgi:cobalt/nickel transport system permease protein